MGPSHCGLLGNDKADELANLGTHLEQVVATTSFSEEKALVKMKKKMDS